ncbi:MAG: cytochrome P450 [Candidatus Eremiobacteraeota bacterium]|nr:cytochrome P450 [Candidatus Eremiobacteraeota bacterium]MCW5871918.1 cytochrome P450 [Candidatus Eremiobacteraeota bacterium]
MQDLLAKFSSQLLTNPYPAYHVIRKLDPVHWSDSWQSWFVSRYQDVASLMKDNRLSVSQVGKFSQRLEGEQGLDEARAQLKEIERWLASFLLFTDPPAHTRLRGLISKAFTPRSVELLAPVVQERIDRLLEPLQTGQVVDLMEHLAVPLPVMTIADFLGSRPQDFRELAGWSHDLASFLGNEYLSPQSVARSLASLEGMAEYFRGLMEERRQRPEDDLMSRLLQAQHEGSTLQESEILSMCILLFGAGHDTTTNLIANGLLALLQHPSEAARLVRQPELVDKAVEEILRYDSPSLIAVRSVLQEVEVGGKTLLPGDSVNLCLGAANRDPSQFPEPDRFQVERRDGHHIPFGKGIHFCVGSFLARLEARTVFSTFLRKWPNSRLAAPPERIPTLAFRRLKHLQVELLA